MEYQNFELDAFESSEAKSGALRRDKLVYGIRKRYIPKLTRPHFKTDVQAYGMLAKLGICAAAGALVLIGNFYSSADTPVSTQIDAAVEETDGLGKLRFVELTGLLEVFSMGGKYDIPAEYSEISLLEEGTVLKLCSSAKQSVKAPDAGKVKSIGQDDSYGSYVSIVTNDDREIQVYGFSSINVEEGQSVLSGDLLGYVESESQLYVRLLQAGRPGEVKDYFNIKGLV